MTTLVELVRRFGNRDGKQAAAAQQQTLSERLRALTTADLAVEIMPAFGPSGMHIGAGRQQGPIQVVSWLLPDAPAKHRQPLLGPVIEALAVLEHANLLTRRSFGRGNTYHASARGTAALTDGDVRAQIA